MKDFQLIIILRTFSKAEMAAFERFVNSPYYNTSTATAQLLAALKKFYPDFSGNDLTKEGLFAEVYAGRKYNRVLLNKLASNLIKLSLEFLTVSNNPLKPYSLLRGLRKKGLGSLFRSTLNRTQKALERENLNEGDTVHQMLVKMENANFNLDTDNYLGFEVSSMQHMELNTVYFLERVAANYIKKTNIAVSEEAEENKIIKHINSSINYESLYEEVSGSQLYYKKRLLHYLTMILLHKNRDERHYRKIKATLFDTKLLDVEVINLGYIYMLDFITYKIKSGDSSYLQERHTVYKKIEAESFASGNVKIIYTFFRNFILSGINTGDFRWSKYVLEKYINEIEGKGNTGIRFYLEALIFFHEGIFEGALNSINKLDLKKLMMDKFGLFFDIRFLKFKIYFELDLIEESLALIDSFEHFLKKDERINASLKPSYYGFIKYYKKFTRCRIREDYSAIASSIEKIQREDVHEKKWLIKKAAELTGNISVKK